MKQKIILASNNKHKIEEFSQILTNYEILSLKDIGYYDDIVEDGETFLDNALIKANAVREFLNGKVDALIVADDSGLCVNALNGEPGVYSARYGGSHGNNAANRAKLIKNLDGKKDRSAYFICMLVLMSADGSYEYFEGKTYGKILEKETGDTSFCYDCLFLSDDLKKSFGEASSSEKNSVSHRFRAIQKLKQALGFKNQ